MRILFVTSTRIGDAVLSTGILGWLIERHPGARLTVACGPAAAPLFEALPGLERTIVMTKRGVGLHWISLWLATVGRRWDLVVDLRGSLLSWLVPARARRVLWGHDESEPRVAEAARLLGVAPPPAPRLWTLTRHERAAAEQIPAGAPVLALAPCANWPPKAWPAPRFAALIAALTGPGGRLADAAVAVFATAEERSAAAPVLAAIPSARRLDLVGRLDLLTVYACLKRATLFIGNDSALMHMAAAAGIPTLGLFGPSPVRRYGPWGPLADAVTTTEDYRHLLEAADDPQRPKGTLMDTISVERVIAAAGALLDRAAAQQAGPAQAGSG